MPQFRKGDHVEYHPIGGTISFHTPNLLYTFLKDMAMTNCGVGGIQGEVERQQALAKSSAYSLSPILRVASISTSTLVRTSHAMRYGNSHPILGSWVYRGPLNGCAGWRYRSGTTTRERRAQLKRRISRGYWKIELPVAGTCGGKGFSFGLFF